jgi:hypothetical protein
MNHTKKSYIVPYQRYEQFLNWETNKNEKESIATQTSEDRNFQNLKSENFASPESRNKDESVNKHIPRAPPPGLPDDNNRKRSLFIEKDKHAIITKKKKTIITKKKKTINNTLNSLPKKQNKQSILKRNWISYG